jgi:hypothetical protein
LRHEAVDDAVEHHVVIGTGFRQSHDLLDMLGRDIGSQIDHDLAVGGARHVDHKVRTGAVAFGKGGGCGQQQGRKGFTQHRRPRAR